MCSQIQYLIIQLMTLLTIVIAVPKMPSCHDNHIWIADGSVDCKYLQTPSSNGVHKRPKYFCTKYALTDCCKTCTRLGYGPDYKPTTTAATTTDAGQTTIFVTKQTTTPLPSSVTKDTGCKDNHIWIADGSVQCKYLKQHSNHGVHKKPAYYCKSYSLTDCCKTCKELGYGSDVTMPTLETTTSASVTSQSTTEHPICRDFGVYTSSNRIMPCSIIESREVPRGLTRSSDRRVRNSCNVYLWIMCCNTCSRISGTKINRPSAIHN